MLLGVTENVSEPKAVIFRRAVPKPKNEICVICVICGFYKVFSVSSVSLWWNHVVLAASLDFSFRAAR